MGGDRGSYLRCTRVSHAWCCWRRLAGATTYWSSSGGQLGSSTNMAPPSFGCMGGYQAHRHPRVRIVQAPPGTEVVCHPQVHTARWHTASPFHVSTNTRRIQFNSTHAGHPAIRWLTPRESGHLTRTAPLRVTGCDSSSATTHAWLHASARWKRCAHGNNTMGSASPHHHWSSRPRWFTRGGGLLLCGGGRRLLCHSNFGHLARFLQLRLWALHVTPADGNHPHCNCPCDGVQCPPTTRRPRPPRETHPTPTQPTDVGHNRL